MWSASISTVFTVNLLLQKLKRSSKLGPSRSMTITLYSPSIPYHRRFGIPAATVGYWYQQLHEVTPTEPVHDVLTPALKNFVQFRLI